MKLFVYGTLRKGMINHYMMQGCTFIDYGYIKGSLYMVSNFNYPGFILEGDTLVLGEIYDVPEFLIKELDNFEGYINENNPDNLYDKVICNIYDKKGVPSDYLSVYVYHKENNPPLTNKIESGNFKERAH